MSLDLGERRIGIALSDPGRQFARPLLVLRRRSKVEDFERIARLVREQEVELLVIGHPLDSEGRAGHQAKRAERYTAALVNALEEEGLSPAVQFWDESLSTHEAQATMIANKRKRKGRKARLDAVAAAVILQSYLNSSGAVLGGRDAPPGSDATETRSEEGL